MGIMSWLGFGTANTLANTAQTVSDIAGKWISNPGDREIEVNKVMQAVQSDVQSARTFGNALPGDTGFSAFADGVNKLIRPCLAVGVIGGLYGWWALPDITHLPEFYSTLGYAVVGFYFGVVSVVDDLPRGIAKLLTVIKG